MEILIWLNKGDKVVKVDKVEKVMMMIICSTEISDCLFGI
jgi:hypothetical protein